MLLAYKEFAKIFNEVIFEKSKADLLTKISENPNRYIGLFRPTKPKAKILQNLLQSHEIRFGDAFEKIIEIYFQLKGCEISPKSFKTENNDSLNNVNFVKEAQYLKAKSSIFVTSGAEKDSNQVLE